MAASTCTSLCFSQLNISAFRASAARQIKMPQRLPWLSIAAPQASAMPIQQRRPPRNSTKHPGPLQHHGLTAPLSATSGEIIKQRSALSRASSHGCNLGKLARWDNENSQPTPPFLALKMAIESGPHRVVLPGCMNALQHRIQKFSNFSTNVFGCKAAKTLTSRLMS